MTQHANSAHSQLTPHSQSSRNAPNGITANTIAHRIQLYPIACNRSRKLFIADRRPILCRHVAQSFFCQHTAQVLTGTTQLFAETRLKFLSIHWSILCRHMAQVLADTRLKILSIRGPILCRHTAQKYANTRYSVLTTHGSHTCRRTARVYVDTRLLADTMHGSFADTWLLADTRLLEVEFLKRNCRDTAPLTDTRLHETCG